ncbi:MAG: aldo/keto reductase [Betaproteobacteria bacterium]|jgi:aryl-alcohol dehydrogenase-like predicted oxidoreductase|nr:aldo/keto reductase [Betaproteobacteria bacterium]
MNAPHFNTRRNLLRIGAGLGAAALAPQLAAQAKPAPLLSRKIPKSGELLPVIGLGTAIIFDIGNDSEKRAERSAVIRTLLDGGAKMIDTAPSYGTAESVLGDLLAAAKLRDRVFLATKVRSNDNEAFVAQMKQSQQRLHSPKIDLMLMHNVGFLDRGMVASQLAIVREWKQQGIFRHIGVTHSQDQARANERLIEIMQQDKIDFIQVNYSMAERSVEDRLLAAAADTGTALMCNLPFGRARLFRAVQGRTVPDWAAEFDAVTWGQFFLKYLLAQPAVNVVIPGTDRVEYMLDNLNAGRGRLPDAAMRKRMAAHIDAVL